jgi:protocatechuate 4,5-dioxygenase alpha subunit
MNSVGSLGADSPFGPPADIVGVGRYHGELAQGALRLNRFLIHISQRGNRESYLADEEGAMQAWGLAASERELVLRRDFVGLLAAGVNIYAIAKSGYVFGATLLEIGGAMRGESIETFLAQRGRC